MPKANTYFHTSQGEYSDYGIGQHYKVLMDFNFVEQCKHWILLKNIDADKVGFNENNTSFRFIKDWDDSDLKERAYFEYLIELGYIEELEFEEYHTGSYGGFELGDESYD